MRAGSRSALKRVHSRRNLRVRTSDAMAKARPSLSEATYAPVSKRAGSRSGLKRVHSRRNLRVRTSDAMAKARPSRLRPLTLRFLSAPVHALAT